jgi:hypothetical protein
MLAELRRQAEICADVFDTPASDAAVGRASVVNGVIKNLFTNASSITGGYLTVCLTALGSPGVSEPVWYGGNRQKYGSFGRARK